MNDAYNITSYMVIDNILKAWDYYEDCRASGHASEILTVAVMAAKYFHNHHERTLYILIRLVVCYATECVAFQPRFAWIEGLVARDRGSGGCAVAIGAGLHHG